MFSVLGFCSSGLSYCKKRILKSEEARREIIIPQDSFRESCHNILLPHLLLLHTADYEVLHSSCTYSTLLPLSPTRIVSSCLRLCQTIDSQPHQHRLQHVRHRQQYLIYRMSVCTPATHTHCLLYVVDLDFTARKRCAAFDR